MNGRMEYTDFFDMTSADSRKVQQTREDFSQMFTRLLSKLGIDDSSAAKMERWLWDLMADPSRHYHTPVHVLGMLQYADRAGLKLSDDQQLAVWFHDVIHSSHHKNGENENASADLMVKEMAAVGVNGSLVDVAAENIRWTACHLEYDIPAAYHPIMDLDIAGLAASPDSFARQSAAVRAELKHIPEDEYAGNTIAFFQQLLKRPTVFRTDVFTPYEQTARAQIQGEIDRLAQSL